MGLLDIFGKKDVSGELMKKVPFSLKLNLSPFRLASNKSDSVRLAVDLTNLADTYQLASVVVEVPPGLGFDQTGISRTREIRLGELKPKEKKSLFVDIWGNATTSKGEYAITVTAFSHYRNYSYILNSERKKTVLRAV